MEENQPLVSVAVITYNSSKTVVETLDSIAGQTYPNLELIVSDDCSTDNTVEVCRNWIDLHEERFVRTELLTAEKNTGVSANMNRAERTCRGKWVKPIAGDDMLLPDCVEVYVDYVKAHPSAIYVFASMAVIGGNEEAREKMLGYFGKEFFDWTIDQQLAFLIQERDCIPAPTSFYDKSEVLSLGVVYDERIPFMEDWPRWINLLKKSVKFHFVEKETVVYRISNESLSTSVVKSDKFTKSQALFFLYYQFEDWYKAGKRRLAIKRYVQSKKTATGSFFWRAANFLVKRIL